MRCPTRPFPLVVALVLACVFRTVGPAASPVDLSGLDQVVAAELKRAQVPGCAVAVIVGGEIALAKGYGVANVDTGEAVSADMLFRLGSTTKMFTAAGLVLLAEDGRVQLDAPIGRYVPRLDPAIARLTSHQLLSHTSGLADPNAMEGPHDETALGERVRALGPRDFFDEPGRVYSYSNAGYWLAGFVAEEVSGKRYADHLHERLFAPLGMRRTTFRPTMAMTWPLAVGHGPADNSPPAVIRPLADNAAVWPAGQLFTTAREFARFCQAFMNGGELDGRQVLSRFVIDRLSSPQAVVPGDDRHYGYGLGVRTEGGRRWLSHSGSRTGYGSLVRMCPELKFAVIILCNKSGASLPRVADRAVQLALQIAPPAPPATKPVDLTAAEITAAAGTYSNGQSKIELRARNGRLVSALGGTITKVGPQRYVRAAAGATPALEFTLVTDQAGGVTHLVSRGRAWKKLP